MNRVRHLAHALAGLVVLAAAGVVLGQKSVADGMRHSSGDKAAAVAVIVVLVLFVLVSLVRVFATPKPQGRSGLPYAVIGRRK